MQLHFNAQKTIMNQEFVIIHDYLYLGCIDQEGKHTPSTKPIVLGVYLNMPRQVLNI